MATSYPFQFASIADLEALGPAAGLTVQTAWVYGEHSGMYEWNAASTDTPVAGRIVQATGVTTGRFIRNEAAVYSLYAYAKSGIFASDQAALVACDSDAASAGAVAVLDYPVTLTANTTLTATWKKEGGSGLFTLGSYNLTFSSQPFYCGVEQAFSTGGTGAVLGTILGDICIDWWGTTSTSVLDGATTNAGNAALTYIAQSANPSATLWCGKPNYYLSGPWIKASSFNCPYFRGNGATLNYTFNSEGPIQVVGGSGTMALGVVDGFNFNGTGAASWGVEIVQQDGMRITNCLFPNALQYGIVLHNRDAGGFTEFVTWDHCQFRSATPWYYKITSGNISFHGSGATSNVVVDWNGTAPFAQMDTGAAVYQAPMNVTIFPAALSSVLISVPSNAYWMTYGTICIENNVSGTLTLATTSGYACLHTGAIQGWGNPWVLGALVHLHFQLFEGSVLRGFDRGTWTTVGLPAGGSTTAVQIGPSLSQDFLLTIFVNGPNYGYKYKAIVGTDAFGASSLTIIATELQNNGAGWGAPTLSWNSLNQLGVVNSNITANSTNVTVTAVDLSGNFVNS